MSEKIFFNIFKRGSKTYFYSSFFFPPALRKDVFRLYGFVRTVDDLVDTFPQKKKEFYSFVKEFSRVRKGKQSDNPVLREFVYLEKEKKFDPAWADAFLESMKSDLQGKKLRTLKDIEKYMYGSAEVIGLYMAKILGVPKEGYPCARYLGKSMQYINFIRDIDEDICLGRNYFPLAEYTQCGIIPQNRESMISNPTGFKKFMHLQIARYKKWQKEAEKGYVHLPKKYRIGVKTAADMYIWTANKIEKDPQLVFQKKIKPTKTHIIGRGIHNIVRESELFKEL